MKRDLVTGPRLLVAAESHTVTERLEGASHSCSLPERLLGMHLKGESPWEEVTVWGEGSRLPNTEMGEGPSAAGVSQPWEGGSGTEEKVAGQSRV